MTHEIVRWPDVPDYEVRISLADDRVTGPFSLFPGYRRWSFLASTAPIHLEIGGITHELVVLGDHIEVDGDTAITCALPAGATRLLNVLVRHTAASTTQIGRGPCPYPIRFAFALSVQPELPAGHALLLDPPEATALDRHAAWVR